MRNWLCRRSVSLAIGVVMCLSAYSFLTAQTPAALEQQLVATTDGSARQTLFHQLIVAYQHISIDTALMYSQQALQEAKALGNDSLLAKAHLRMCPFYLYKGEVDAALAHAELAQQIGSRMNSLATTSSAHQLMANAYYHQGDAARAISYNRRSLAGYSSLKHAVGIRVLRGNLANLYAETGKLDSALLQAIAYEEIAAQTTHVPSQGRAALLLSKIYSELDQKEKSKVYLYRAKAVFSAEGYPSQRANTLSLLANMHQEEGQVDSAIYYHLAALDINQTLGNPGNMAAVEGELGLAYLEAKQWQAAYTYLHKSVSANRALGQEVGLAHNYVGLARYFSAQPTTDSVLFYLDKSLEAARLHKVAAVEGEALQALVRFHEAENDYRRALLYHKQYLEFLNATRGLETEKTIASLEAKYETEKKERRIERLELQAVADNSRNNALKMGLVGSILVFGMLAAALWYRRKNEQQLFAFQQQMHEQEKKELDQQLIFKTKELTSHALHMVQKNKVLQELKRSISALAKNAQATDKKALRAITRRIDTNIQSDDDWNTFRLYFEQINQNFYHKLGEISRELTPTELKLCSLIKLNMNIKETASVLNIEPSSVKTARHRLRKKLGLQQGEDLASFIRQIV